MIRLEHLGKPLNAGRGFPHPYREPEKRQPLNLAVEDCDEPGCFTLDDVIVAPSLAETELPDSHWWAWLAPQSRAERWESGEHYFDVAEALQRLAHAAPAGQAMSRDDVPIIAPLAKLTAAQLAWNITDRPLDSPGIRPLLEEAARRIATRCAWKVNDIASHLNAGLPPPGEEEPEPDEEETAPRLPLLVPAGELVRLPARVDWLVRGILERECLGLLFGDPAAGKSFVALSMAAAVATGTPWQGHRTTAGPVAYIAGEGHAGIARRLKAIEDHHGLSLDDAPLFVSRRAVPMLDSLAVDALAGELASLSTHPAMIVIDTLARALAGGEENSAADVGLFVAACDRLKSRFKAAVLVVHHAGHGDKTRARGSSALRAAVDVEMGLARLQEAPDVLALTCSKAKDAEPFETLHFELRGVALPWADDEGEPIHSAVLVASDFTQADAPRKPKGRNQDAALATLRRLLSENRARLEGAGYPLEQARVSVSDWKEALREEGMHRSRIHEAVSSLIQGGQVRQEGIHVFPI